MGGVSVMFKVMGEGVRGVCQFQGDGRGVSHVHGDGMGVSHVQGDGRGEGRQSWSM